MKGNENWRGGEREVNKEKGRVKEKEGLKENEVKDRDIKEEWIKQRRTR